MNYERILQQLLADTNTGITFNGTQPWDPQVHDKRAYARILKEANLGAGESYMDKWMVQ
ncbi:MAG: Cyclopropane-fatty-acyl-phospholipid synthase [Parcubacteria group bacterium GW2011_GWA2_47_8]|nr:MAG: Cyclopropane-fatty-acyl-phospholipid synthase [Parcubacteria group bacterium GW2011_GWA2_47_8]